MNYRGFIENSDGTENKVYCFSKETYLNCFLINNNTTSFKFKLNHRIVLNYLSVTKCE